MALQKEKRFPERWVHLDLKGAPPKLLYLKNLLPLFKSWGCTGLLIEFEDTFPYSGELRPLRSSVAYNDDELQEFFALIQSHEMNIIPLIQTFGHLEFLLKHEVFCHLREVPEYPTSICPSFPESIRILKLMLDQVVALIPNLQYFHIGCDEVSYVNRCSSCQERMLADDLIFIQHVKAIARYVLDSYGIQPIIWDDMLRGIDPSRIKETGLNEVVEVMAWEYQDVQKLRQGHLSMLDSIFSGLWFASAFKGATSPYQIVTPTGFHVENHFQWLNVLNETAIQPKGIALTGWSRFDHYASLCDLLPVALPTLAVCLSMATTGYFTKEMHQTLSSELGFSVLIPWHPMDKEFDPDTTLNFPGWKIYQGVHLLLRLDRESDVLINGDLRRAWLSKRHVRKAQTSPAIAEQLMKTATRFISRYHHLNVGLHECFTELYHDVTIEEWLETYLLPRRDELQDVFADSDHLVAIGASVIQS